MNKHRRGYRAAAKHFAATEEELRQLCRGGSVSRARRAPETSNIPSTQRDQIRAGLKGVLLRKAKDGNISAIRELARMLDEDAPEVTQKVGQQLVRDWAGMADVEYWSALLNHNMTRAMTETGIAAKDAARLAMEARRRLEEVRPSTETRPLTKEEREAALRQMDEQWLEEAAAELALRHRARFLLVTDSHRAEMESDGSWTTTIIQ